MTDLTVVLAYLGAVAAAGLLAARARRSGMADYVLAGRALTLPSFVATLVPTFYGGVLGIGEFTWQSGLSNWLVMGAPYYFFAALYAWLLAGKVRVAEGLTIPDHLERAYGRPMALFAALLVFVIACPSDELLMTGSLLSHLTGLSLPTMMGASALLGLGLLSRGGLRSDVWANRLQILVMFGGFFLVLPYARERAGGWSELAAAVPAGHLSLTGGLPPLRILAWWLIALWTLVDPAFHQRCAAAADPATARRGILVSIAFWALFDVMTTTAGLYARALEPDLARPLLAFPVLADKVLPPFLRGLFFAGLLSSMLAALQGTSLLSAVAFGRDGLGRWRGASEVEQERWTRAGLWVTGLCALALAWALPSVVGLWYAVGSAVIPGLLLPLLGVYFPRLRVSPTTALASSLGGTGLSLAWLLCQQLTGEPPLGLEPMFPGLGLSCALWLAGRARG